MSKLKFFMFLSFAATALLFTSCETTEDGETDPNVGPTITIDGSTELTVTAGDRVTTTINVVSTDERIASFSVIKNSNTIFTKDSDFDDNNAYTYAFDYQTLAEEEGTTITFGFEAVDRKGNRASRSLTVTVESGETDPDPIAFETFSGVRLGAQSNSSLGSFYDADGNEVFTLSAAGNNSAAVDLVFLYGEINKGTLASPSDETVPFVFDQVEGWSTVNTTELKRLTMTASEFDAIEDGANIIAAFNNGSAPSEGQRINNLSGGDVFAYKTTNGTTGVVKVNTIDASASGVVSFDVKAVK